MFLLYLFNFIPFTSFYCFVSIYGWIIFILQIIILFIIYVHLNSEFIIMYFIFPFEYVSMFS